MFIVLFQNVKVLFGYKYLTRLFFSVKVGRSDSSTLCSQSTERSCAQSEVFSSKRCLTYQCSGSTSRRSGHSSCHQRGKHSLVQQWKLFIAYYKFCYDWNITFKLSNIICEFVLQGVDIQTLNEALITANLTPMSLACDCMNGAMCRQRIKLQPETLYTIATDVTSFVAPGHSHQLYCACNLGFAGI